MLKTLKILFNGLLTEYPCIKTVLSALSKGNALVHWSINCMASYLLEHRQKLNLNPESFENLIKDAKSNFREIHLKSKDSASKAFEIIELYLEQSKDYKKELSKKGQDKKVQKALALFESFEQEHNVQWLAFRLPVFHPHLAYADFIDALAIVNDELCLIDFHVASSIYAEHELLSAARLSAFNYLIDEKISFIYNGKQYNYQDFAKPLYSKALVLCKEDCSFIYKDFAKKKPSFETWKARKQKAFEGLLTYYYYSSNKKLLNNNKIFAA